MNGRYSMGLVFNIQRYSVHDGPGIRTLVFMKGCPMRCLWCCNPEGQNPYPEMAYFESLCSRCRKCVAACPKKAITVSEDGQLRTLRELCDNCGQCVVVCPRQARQVFGKYYTVNEVLEIAKKDTAFYWRSGGGITVGGGEPLSQPDFVRELLENAKEQYGLHTAVETSGYAEPDVIERVLGSVDLVLFDLKHIDPHKHLKLTGMSNDLILRNIRLVVNRIVPEKKELLIRVTVVPSLNDDVDDLLCFAEFVKSLGEGVRVELLPYHEFGVAKYRALDRRYFLEAGIQPPSGEYMEALRDILRRKDVPTL